MWLVAEYQPTAMFSLKPAWATSSGGKSLLLPTPYAIKMALLDAICRTQGANEGEEMWPAIRDLIVALRGPDRIVVNNTFTRILKPKRADASSDPDPGAYQRSIGFREYVYHAGPIGIGLRFAGDSDGNAARNLTNGLLQINYLGKRGGFVQLLAPPQILDTLPGGFLTIEDNDSGSFQIDGIMHELDDTGPTVTFEQVNVFSDKNIKLGKERVLRHVILPYRLVRSSKAYTYYQRIDTQ